ncbi:MAG: Asp23/Gls24 family envelope stress response protein [Clostridia bacterium]
MNKKTTTKKVKEEAVEEVEILATEESNVEIASNLNISEEVISIIAGLAAAEVEGVSGMSLGFVDGVSEMLGKKRYSKGVKIEMDGASVIIDIFVIVQYGVRIPDVAWSIQNNVKEAVENMTGLNVRAVNINVQGVTFEKQVKDETVAE